MLHIEFELTKEQADELLTVLRQVAGEDHFEEAEQVRAFNVASDKCRAALISALEPEPEPQEDDLDLRAALAKHPPRKRKT